MRFLAYAEDSEGYPVWDFEAFYQQGMACFGNRPANTPF